MSLFNFDEDTDYGNGSGSLGFGQNDYASGTGSNYGLGGNSGYDTGFGSGQTGIGIGQGYDSGGFGDASGTGSLDFGGGVGFNPSGQGRGGMDPEIRRSLNRLGVSTDCFGTSGNTSTPGTGSLDFGLKTYGQADNSRTDPIWSDPYNRPQTKGPFSGWSTNAMEKFKESASPRDYGDFLQDRIGTYVANRINMDRPPLEP